jgi:hypothetical protein
MELTSALSKTRSYGTSHSLVHYIYSTELMIDFDSKRLLHAYAADTLNECQIVAGRTIYEKQQRN